MPTSNIHVSSEIIALVHQVPHAKIIEIGPGYGKYGLMLREYLNLKPQQLDCVEATRSYIDRFHWLKCLYDTVHHADCLDLPYEFYNQYDVVLIIDVIEHLDKQKAIEFLKNVKAQIIICTPVEFFEQEFENNPYEHHVSHWTEKDFAPFAEVLYQSCGGWLVRTKKKP